MSATIKPKRQTRTPPDPPLKKERTMNKSDLPDQWEPLRKTKLCSIVKNSQNNLICKQYLSSHQIDQFIILVRHCREVERLLGEFAFCIQIDGGIKDLLIAPTTALSRYGTHGYEWFSSCRIYSGSPMGGPIPNTYILCKFQDLSVTNQNTIRNLMPDVPWRAITRPGVHLTKKQLFLLKRRLKKLKKEQADVVKEWWENEKLQMEEAIFEDI
jgi:hypothetical protein